MLGKIALFVLLAVSLGAGADILSYRQLPNYGVTMQYLGKVDIKAQRWRHEYRLRIPTLEQIYRNLTYCSARTNSCDGAPMTNRYMDNLNTLVKARYDKFRGFLRTLFPEGGAIPESDTDQLLLQKFESVTMPPVSDLTGVLNANDITDFDIPPLMVMKYQPLGYISDKDVDSLFKYADTVQRGLVQNDGHMRNLARNITQAMRDMTFDSFDTASYVAAAATSAVEALQTMDFLQDSALFLASGRLPGNLVTPKEINTSFDAIRKTVKFSSSRFAIAVTDPKYYYALDSVKTHLVDDRLSIFVDVPVSMDPQMTWDLWHTEAYPLATSQDPKTRSATVLSGFQPYLLVKPDFSDYLELSQDELDTCPGRTPMKLCQQYFSEVSTKVSSCHLALFQDDVEKVNALCQLNLLKNGIRPYMKELEPGLYLMNKVTNPLLDCPKKVLDASIFTSCQQCLRRIPCQCSIRSDFVATQPRMVQGCVDEGQPETNYTLNVLLMRKAGRNTNGLTGASSVDSTILQKLGVTFSEDDIDGLMNGPTEVTLQVQNLPSPEAQVEAVPSGMGVGGYLSIVALLLGIILFTVTMWKWRQMEKELKAISARQAGVDLPIVLNGNGFRHEEEEEAQNHLMEVREES